MPGALLRGARAIRCLVRELFGALFRGSRVPVFLRRRRGRGRIQKLHNVLLQLLELIPDQFLVAFAFLFNFIDGLDQAVELFARHELAGVDLVILGAQGADLVFVLFEILRARST